MLMIVFGFALLVLAAAIIVLFAMLGQLAAGSPGTRSRYRDRTLRTVQTTRMGQAPGTWPAALMGLEDDCVLIVLSTVCASCADVAGQLREGGYRDWADLGIIVSTAGTLHATDWVAQNGITPFRHHIDEGGQWTGDEFGLRTSPSALIIRGGKLVAAYVFHDVESLRARISAEHANVLGGNATQRMEKEAV
jgi:hypothetical protein